MQKHYSVIPAVLTAKPKTKVVPEAEQLSASTLRSLYHYDATEGCLRRKLPGRLFGRPKLGPPITGTTITIRGERYSVSRLIWLYLYNTWPTGRIIQASKEVVTIGGHRYHQMISSSQTGEQNIYYLPRGNLSNPYLVRFTENRLTHYVGRFRSLERARSALQAYRMSLLKGPSATQPSLH